MDDYVEMDNLPTTSNHILNILWEHNTDMTLEELTDSVNTRFGTSWNKKEIQQFAELLVKMEYVVELQHGLGVSYAALGYDLDFE